MTKLSAPPILQVFRFGLRAIDLLRLLPLIGRRGPEIRNARAKQRRNVRAEPGINTRILLTLSRFGRVASEHGGCDQKDEPCDGEPFLAHDLQQRNDFVASLLSSAADAVVTEKSKAHAGRLPNLPDFPRRGKK